jgi:tetratricopeptide (TPR) repeat protein
MAQKAKQGNPQYYVVVASTASQMEARLMVQSMAKRYSLNMKVVTCRDGKYRITTNVFTTKRYAQEECDRVRRRIASDAWVWTAQAGDIRNTYVEQSPAPDPDDDEEEEEEEEEEYTPRYLRRGNELYQQKDYAAAIEYYKLALSDAEGQNMDDTDIMNRLGNAYYMQGKYELAIDCYKKVLKKTPNDKVVKGNLQLASNEQAKQKPPVAKKEETKTGYTTYYYKQILKVNGGQKSSGDNSHLFIAIHSKGCYDSDKEGYTVKNGTLEYQGTNGGYHIYHGSCFFGKASYQFSSDYGRLNIRVENSNMVYVYEKATPPQGVMTCSNIKQENPDPAPTPYPVPYPAPLPSPTPYPSPSPSPTPKPSEYGYVSCVQCYGSGNCSTCGGDGLMDNHYGGKYNAIKCSSCSWGKCRSCSGSGKVYKRIR